MKWTVYNKEKPQKVGSYLVTHTTDRGRYYVDYDFWTVYDEFKYHSTDVVAWMPFPKPYNKDEPQCEACINYGVEFTDDDSFDTCLANECHYEPKPEPQTHCKDCKYAWWNSDAKRYECSVGRCQYEDEPQTERGE